MEIQEDGKKEMKTVQERERVLLFSSREICYMSGNFFAHQLGAAFEELGYEAEVCEFTREDDYDPLLRSCMEREYRAVIDFNSLLPRMEMEDQSSYLDHLNGPFYDYLLDHPLFHYNGLVTRAKNFHALVLDEAQREYTAKYYPNVKSTHMLPLGATEAMYHGPKNPADHIFFPGTYDSPDEVYHLIEVSPEPLQSIMRDLVERRLAEPLLPMEEAFGRYLAERGMELADADFALYMNAMYPVDAYIRDYFRKAAVDALLRAGISVRAAGTGWEKYHEPAGTRLERQKSVPFAVSFEKIAAEEVLLDVSPIFSRGMHDRIPAGMANRAAVLTDGNPYLEKTFQDGANLCLYSLSDLSTLTELAGRLLEDPGFRETIQENAYQEYKRKHTWRNRAEVILGYTDEDFEREG